ncbi:hypothetical protein HYV50_02245 [Candidatus Pacearchaeota archaeon]|nr:hypothetical protein [Candidatus Pacearchaeota archaeon]
MGLEEGLSRRDFIRTAGGIILVGGCGVSNIYNEIQDQSPVGAGDYANEIRLPPLSDSRYASKMLAYSDNLVEAQGNRAENMLGQPDSFYRQARFVCSYYDPLQVVVGFGGDFERVTIRAYFDRPLNVQGWSGQVIYLQKSREEIEKLKVNGKIFLNNFYADPERTEAGFAGPVYPETIGGEIQLDVGYTPERIFLFEAWPDSGSMEVGINYIARNVD